MSSDTIKNKNKNGPFCDENGPSMGIVDSYCRLRLNESQVTVTVSGNYIIFTVLTGLIPFPKEEQQNEIRLQQIKA